MLDDLALFVRIVEAGSLRAAANSIQTPAATVTRRLQKLEEALGCQLLHRSARLMLPTQEGMQYYEQCRPLLQALQQTTQSLDANLTQLSGSVRVLAPSNLANGPFRGAWIRFMRLYPSIRLELQLSNHNQDLLGSGADLAIRVGEQIDSSFRQRRLGAVRNVLTASPEYLQRSAQLHAPEQLQQHQLIVIEPALQWRLVERATGVVQTLVPQGHFRVNEAQLAVHMAVSGVGVLRCPVIQVADELNAGVLVEVMPHWEAATRPVYALWPQSRQMPARVRVLLDQLVACALESPLLNPDAAHGQK